MKTYETVSDTIIYEISALMIDNKLASYRLFNVYDVIDDPLIFQSVFLFTDISYLTQYYLNALIIFHY